MTKAISAGLGGTILVAVLVLSPAYAQQPQTQRVLGTIERVDGSTLAVKTRDGEVRVNMTDNVAVFGVIRAGLTDIKPGTFIGVGAMPQPDGTQKAMQVMIFSEVQRGTGEGHRPWIHPNSTMTNATVQNSVAAVDGQTVIVKYKDGEKKVVVPPEATIRAYVVGDKSELKPGANILITQAVKKPDGSLETSRVNVGRDGVVPQ
jgi:hypothetical protein